MNDYRGKNRIVNQPAEADADDALTRRMVSCRFQGA